MHSLPANIEQNIQHFVSAAQNAFGPDLLSAVLYGSAADGQMRASSDVNLLLLIKRFEADAANELREPLRLAHAAMQLKVMFLLEGELDAAASAFAVKFADMQDRHRVLFGSDPFERLTTSRAALLHRLKQILLNLQLRLRERYVMVSLREEKLLPLIADSAAPLRASAAQILQLRGQAAVPAKQALQLLVQENGDTVWLQALQYMSQAREGHSLPAGQALPTVLALGQISEHLRQCALALDTPATGAEPPC